MPKYMPMMFFYFLKIIFDISTSKRSKRYKPHSILAKKKFKFGQNTGTNAIPNVLLLYMEPILFLYSKHKEIKAKNSALRALFILIALVIEQCN